MVESLKDSVRRGAIKERMRAIEETVSHYARQIARIEEKKLALFKEFRDLQKEELMILRKENPNG